MPLFTTTPPTSHPAWQNRLPNEVGTFFLATHSTFRTVATQTAYNAFSGPPIGDVMLYLRATFPTDYAYAISVVRARRSPTAIAAPSSPAELHALVNKIVGRIMLMEVKMVFEAMQKKHHDGTLQTGAGLTRQIEEEFERVGRVGMFSNNHICCVIAQIRE